MDIYSDMHRNACLVQNRPSRITLFNSRYFPRPLPHPFVGHYPCDSKKKENHKIDYYA